MPQPFQGHHEKKVTPHKKQSLQELEEIITELTILEQALRKENETQKENNLHMQKKHEEWHQKATRIMKKKQAQNDHLKIKDEIYRGHIQVKASGAQLDQLPVAQGKG